MTTYPDQPADRTTRLGAGKCATPFDRAAFIRSADSHTGGHTGGRTDSHTGGHTGGQTDSHTGSHTDSHTDSHTGGQTDGYERHPMAAEMARALGSLLRGGWPLITLMIGSDAVCSDGYRGEVRAAVIDPVARTLTHIVVEPKGRVGLARLVPLGLVEAAPDKAAPHEAASDQVRLRCTEAEFMSLDPAEETVAEFVPGYPDPVQLLPPGWRGAGGPTVEGGTILRIPEQETIDVIPAGEVEERGDHVHATDGDIGHLHALRVDPADGRITQVLVRRGPVWDRRDAAIPFDQVAGFDDGIRLSLTRQQVKDLPPAAP